MEVSAGFIIRTASGILLGHTTGAKHWDFPKGKIELNEIAFDAACRELTEETSLTLVDGVLSYKFYPSIIHSVSDIIDHGVHSYTKWKDLHLFTIVIQDSLFLAYLRCLSMVEKDTYSFPELDRFITTPEDKVIEYTTANMSSYIKTHCGF